MFGANSVHFCTDPALCSEQKELGLGIAFSIDLAFTSSNAVLGTEAHSLHTAMFVCVQSCGCSIGKNELL